MVQDNQPLGDTPPQSIGREKSHVADVKHHENGSDLTNIDTHHQTLALEGYELDTDELPKGYFWSAKFLGTFFGVGMNLMGSTVCTSTATVAFLLLI